ncbi:hypothetical protein [Asticcacaulis sp.]|uniref:hypothetical protein n=1 Tax=Asticcacaulis sp. TaxID=1872648 RepID=UPI00262E9EE2|nr:hypothetical protein [Asticcacaulis sp.]
MPLHERQVAINVGDYPASAGTRVALVQDVDDIANRERKPNIQQQRKHHQLENTNTITITKHQ